VRWIFNEAHPPRTRIEERAFRRVELRDALTGLKYWGSWNLPLRNRGRETLKEKLKRYLRTGEWTE
jgi:hypothetical protein